MNIKCIGCYDLLREELTLEGRPLVVYNCPRFFPYVCALSGLLRPGLGIKKAVRLCPDRIDDHCILCSKTKIIHCGQDIVSVCVEHYQDWSKWLDEHPERLAHLAPRGRSVKANWIEVFREFIEDMRKEAEGQP